MGLYKRGDIWHISIKRKGFEFVGSTGCVNKEDAELILAEKIKEARAAKFHVLKETRDMTLQDLYNLYEKSDKVKKIRSWNIEKQKLDLFMRVFKERKLVEVSTEALEDFRDLKMADIEESTFKRYLTSFKSMINWAKKKGHFIGENPCCGFEFEEDENQRYRFLHYEEAPILIDAAQSQRLKDTILLGICTGLRKGAIRRINLKYDFNSKLHRLFLNETKNGERVYIPLNSVAFGILSRQTEETPFDFDCRHSFTQAVIKAGFDTTGPNKVTFHTLRHTFASWLAMQGASTNEIMELGRWKSEKMVRRYMHLSPNHLIGVAEKTATILLQNEKRPELEVKKIDITQGVVNRSAVIASVA